MTKDNNLRFQAIQSMILKGDLKKMKDISTLYPTMMAKGLKLNYSRYIERLYKPELFTIKQIKDMAVLLDIDPQLIIDIILNEPAKGVKTTRKKS